MYDVKQVHVIRSIGASKDNYRVSKESYYFTDEEMIFNPWDHLIDIPVEKRKAFDFARIFEFSSYYQFKRGNEIFDAHFSDVIKVRSGCSGECQVCGTQDGECHCV